MSPPSLCISNEMWKSLDEENRGYLEDITQTLKDQHKQNLLDPVKWKESRERYLENKRSSKFKFNLLGVEPETLDQEPFEPFNDENLQENMK